MSKPIILTPYLSEKTHALASSGDIYTFKVDRDVSKVDIKRAVEEQFKVKVVKVTTTTSKGKVISSYQKRKRPVAGNRATIKKAYVTLKKGDSIDIYEGVEG